MSIIHPLNDHRRGLTPLNEADDGEGGWDDQQVAATMGVGGAALATVALLDTPAKILAMANNGTDSVTFYAQLPHRWDKTQVRPHLHYVPLTIPAAPRVIRFTGQYVWSRPNQLVPRNVAWTPFTIDVPLPIADGEKHIITSIAQVPPPVDAEESDFLIVHLIRDGASLFDTYTDGAVANLGILGMDVHFRAEKSGTAAEFPGA